MILIVDDDPMVCRAVQSLLLNQGYEDVEICYNGKEALDKIRAGQEAPELIILDLMMPIMDGNQLTEQLLMDGVDCPVIVLSGYLGTLKECRLVKQSLAKPADGKTLLKAVENWVRPSKPIQ